MQQKLLAPVLQMMSPLKDNPQSKSLALEFAMQVKDFQNKGMAT
jgi:hypothetical protein